MGRILRNRKWFPSEMILDILVAERDRRFGGNETNPLQDMRTMMSVI